MDLKFSFENLFIDNCNALTANSGNGRVKMESSQCDALSRCLILTLSKTSSQKSLSQRKAYLQIKRIYLQINGKSQQAYRP